MSQPLRQLGAPTAAAARPGPTPPPPPGPVAQSVAIGFRALYVAVALLLLVWLVSNIREIAPDTQAVVMRFGRIVRSQQVGLLLAWPRPIEQVRLLPGPDRQLSQQVRVLQPPSAKAQALISSSGGKQATPKNVAAYLTGDGNVVVLEATLIYRITDPIAYALQQTHVTAALDRLFRATTVHVTASRALNDFLVVQSSSGGGGGGAPAITAVRTEVRNTLLEDMNARLKQLAGSGASLGVEVDRIDMTPYLPPDAKKAFDAVLLATEAADRGVAMARTDAERRRQRAEQERDRLLSSAQASAKEIVSTANVETAPILALEHEETPSTRNSLLLRSYRAGIAGIMDHVGSVTLIDPKSGVRFVMPGKQK